MSDEKVKRTYKHRRLFHVNKITKIVGSLVKEVEALNEHFKRQNEIAAKRLERKRKYKKSKSKVLTNE